MNGNISISRPNQIKKTIVIEINNIKIFRNEQIRKDLLFEGPVPSTRVYQELETPLGNDIENSITGQIYYRDGSGCKPRQGLHGKSIRTSQQDSGAFKPLMSYHDVIRSV
jgi:hypothetical protein